MGKGSSESKWFPQDHKGNKYETNIKIYIETNLLDYIKNVFDERRVESSRLM